MARSSKQIKVSQVILELAVDGKGSVRSLVDASVPKSDRDKILGAKAVEQQSRKGDEKNVRGNQLASNFGLFDREVIEEATC